ncbi:MAG: hypothetical protein H0X50_04640 [Nitrosopumilus sp.]|nr:hypothetical protein [Nitrosopumilus sp.]
MPFENNTFDIVLSANLLFYYSNRFDYSFHLESILEFLRIAREVRIFPIQQSNTKLPEYFDRLLSDIEKRYQKVKFNVEKVQHEFLLGVDKMLFLRH